MAESDGIKGPDSIGPRKIVGETESKPKAPTKSFDSFMKPDSAGPADPSKMATGMGKPSPIDLAQEASLKQSSVTPTTETILSQMKSSSSVLGDLHKQLHTKNLTLKQSQKYLLRNKLKEANKNIGAAAKRAGVPDQAKQPRFKRSTPVEKFISYVTSGQNNLNSAQSMVSKLNSKGSQMNPGDLLMIQIKLSKAQQQLEYSSVLLSKAVDDIKQMFNIQI